MLRAQWNGKVITRTSRYMTAEDFSYYTSKFRCLYFSLGIAKDGLGEAGFHTAEFSASPSAFPFGLSILLHLAKFGTEYAD